MKVLLICLTLFESHLIVAEVVKFIFYSGGFCNELINMEIDNLDKLYQIIAQAII